MSDEIKSEILNVRWSDLVKFSPKQKLASEMAYKYDYVLYGGAAGGGKSYWLRWFPIEWLIRVAYKQYGKKNVVAALFCEDYPALKDRHLTKLAVELPPWLGEVKESTVYGLALILKPEFGSGVVALRNLDDPSKFQSSEFALEAVDELTKNPLETFNFLRSRQRWPGIEHTKFIAGTNPGSVGHNWVRKYWIDKQFPPEEEQSDQFVYVPAKAVDNPYISQTYLRSLASLPEKQRKAFLEGSWDIFEGQFFCYDDKTEILTSNGFVSVSSVNSNDLVATLSFDGEVLFLPATRTWGFDFDGKLYVHEGQAVNFAVTPGHKMWCAPYNKLDKWSFCKVEDLPEISVHQRTARKWLGSSPVTITIRGTGKYLKIPRYTFETGDWCELLGWFLSEGSIYKNSKRAKIKNPIRGFEISQGKHPDRVLRIVELLQRMGIKYNYDGKRFRINSVVLGQYFNQFGKHDTKFIPRDMLGYATSNLRRVFDGLILGDGCQIGKNDGNIFATTSRQLADDMQELCLRLGRTATVVWYPPKKIQHKGYYRVSIYKTGHQTSIMKKQNILQREYSGRVYCITVEPYHTVFVRRNGRAFWSGNTEFNPEMHVCEPFKIPSSWAKVRTIDVSGRGGWTACLWVAIDTDKRAWVYREYYATGRDADEHAKAIAELSVDDNGLPEEYRYTVMDSSAWDKLGMPETYAEIYQRNGVDGLVPSAKKRVMGWDAVHRYLRPREEEAGLPRMKIFDVCKQLIRTLPTLVHDKKVPDDVDSDGEDHPADALRYLFQTLRDQGVPRVETTVEKKLRALREATDETKTRFHYFRNVV